jgi:hypothetical protein
MVIIKNTENNKCYGILVHTGQNVKWCSHGGKQFVGFSKIKDSITIRFSNAISEFVSKRIESGIQT